MQNRIEDMLKLAGKARMSPEEQEAQRLSLAFGNEKIENERVTRDMIHKAADAKSRT